MQKEDTIIIGAGPCGLSCAIALQKKGINPLLIEKGNVAHTIYQFPTHQTFFSSSEKLEIGGMPFVTERQVPTRNQALAYYRTIAERNTLRIHAFEKVDNIVKNSDHFYLHTKKHTGETIEYEAKHVIIATGYYDQPKWLHIPGEHLNKVSHYFKEAHPYYGKNVVVIGCKNSAVDISLELHKAGAHVTVLYRGKEYPKAIKPWILPKFDALVQKEMIQMEFQAEVTEITANEVVYTVGDEQKRIQNDFVFAMTGYLPDTTLLENLGVEINEEKRIPKHDEHTMETNIANCYIAGVVAAGIHNNVIFIENGKLHGEKIAAAICK